jgi:hypothetical protein
MDLQPDLRLEALGGRYALKPDSKPKERIMNPKTENYGTTRRGPLAAAALALALILGAVTAPAQDDTQGNPRPGQGRVSKEGELQSGPSTAAPSGGMKMPGGDRKPDGRPAPAPPAGAQGMEARLKEAKAEVRGDLPPLAEARNLKAEGGPQTGKAIEPKPKGNTLKLVLRVRRNGESQVVSATELAGEAAPATDPTGDYIYEVTDGDQTLAVRALPDPFEGHAYGGPVPEHFFVPLEEATIVVDVPKRSLDSPLEGMSLRLYKLQAGPQVERIDPATVKRLKGEKRLQVVTEVPAAQLAPEIRKKANRVAQ